MDNYSSYARSDYGSKMASSTRPQRAARPTNFKEPDYPDDLNSDVDSENSGGYSLPQPKAKQETTDYER